MIKNRTRIQKASKWLILIAVTVICLGLSACQKSETEPAKEAETGSITQTADEAAQNISDTATEIKEEAIQASDDAAEGVMEETEEAAEAVDTAVEETGEAVGEAADTATEAIPTPNQP
jgi:NAD+--asparagine ADP-ribosyltransferase